MRIGLLVLDLFLPDSGSLKDKRRVVRSLKDRARRRHNVAVSEVDHQDLHQRASLAFVTVATNESQVQKLFDALVDDAHEAAPAGVQQTAREVMG